MTNNPIDQDRLAKRLTNVRAARRCGAKTRAGGACQCPAIHGRNRCRLHGGRSTGAPKGSANGNFTAGEFTAEAIQERQWLRSIVRTYGNTWPGRFHLIVNGTGGALLAGTVMSRTEESSQVPARARKAPVRVKLERINCDVAKSLPPDGDNDVWLDRLKVALGTASIGTLRRLRTGGSQVIRIERVEVKQGGQAVIGNIGPERSLSRGS